MSNEASISELRVLIADDSKAMRAILKGQLNNIGIEDVIEADSGQTAILGLTKNEVDLVLCDWNMPDPNGLEFLKLIRNNEKFKSIPFIMITTEGDKEHIVKAAEAGVSDYIVKPFSPEVLLRKIKQVLH